MPTVQRHADAADIVAFVPTAAMMAGDFTRQPRRSVTRVGRDRAHPSKYRITAARSVRGLAFHEVATADRPCGG